MISLCGTCGGAQKIISKKHKWGLLENGNFLLLLLLCKNVSVFIQKPQKRTFFPKAGISDAKGISG